MLVKKNLVLKFALLAITFGMGSGTFANESRNAIKSAKTNTSTKIIDTSKTRLDFSGEMIEGKMKTPTGMFLTGTKRTSKKNMVHLRSSFKSKLLRTRYSIQSVSH